MNHSIWTISALFAVTLLLGACGKTTNSDGNVTPNPANQSGATVETKAELEAKAAKGDADAQFNLGALYHDGQGVPKDFAKAKKWFEKAATQNDVRAQFNLGVMYYMGEGIKQDYASAKKWFEKAAAVGNPRAQFNLGVMYYRAEGIPQDFTKAFDLFGRAGMQDFQEAQFNIGVMEAKGEGVPADIGKAYAWFSVARDNGNPRTDEVIKNIERALKPDQLKMVKNLAAQLKGAIEDNVQHLKIQTQAAGGLK